MKHIKHDHPEVDTIKVVFTYSKKKKLFRTMRLLENTQEVKDIFIISRPHMRLMRADLAHEQI